MSTALDGEFPKKQMSQLYFLSGFDIFNSLFLLSYLQMVETPLGTKNSKRPLKMKVHKSLLKVKKWDMIGGTFQSLTEKAVW